MSAYWGRHFAAVAIVAAGCLVAAAIFGPEPALAAFGLALLALLWPHLLNLGRLRRWLRRPSLDNLPQGSGPWEEVFAGLYRMLRRQRQSESDLSQTAERFRQASAAMPEGIVILDASDRIVWCNARAERHFGLDLSRDGGQHITYIVRQPQFGAYLESQHYGEPLVMRQMRHGELILSVQLVPYDRSQKLIISRDITHLERIETMRRDFVANVSHELRTPLTVLTGFLETVSGMPNLGNDIARRTLKLMTEQALRMQRLVEDLLTLSRLESAENVLREEPVDMPHLVRQLYQDATGISGGRHRVRLALESDDGLIGAEDELRSAFGNLVSNAVRYTPEDGEIVIAWGRRSGEPVFSVRDTGIGIEAEHIPRLTERFYRVDRGRSRDTGGTGLGLAIVKHVLSRHQGRLEIESIPGQGSTFSAVFPVQRLTAPAAESSAQTAA